jgi:hypothetical protein
MRITFTIAGIIAGVILSGAPAATQVDRTPYGGQRYCLHKRTGTPACIYATLEQCTKFVQTGTHCAPNPRFAGPARPAPTTAAPSFSQSGPTPYGGQAYCLHQRTGTPSCIYQSMAHCRQFVQTGMQCAKNPRFAGTPRSSGAGVGGPPLNPGAADTAPLGGRAYCLQKQPGGRVCNYDTLAQCAQFARAGGGQCVRNPRVTEGRSTR